MLLPAQRQSQHMQENVLTARRMADKWTWNPDRPHTELQPSEYVRWDAAFHFSLTCCHEHLIYKVWLFWYNPPTLSTGSSLQFNQDSASLCVMMGSLNPTPTYSLPYTKMPSPPNNPIRLYICLNINMGLLFSIEKCSTVADKVLGNLGFTCHPASLPLFHSMLA